MAIVLEPLAAGWQRAGAVASRIREHLPGALTDPVADGLRGLLPIVDDRALEQLDAELDRIAREERLVGGRSGPRPGVVAAAAGLQEAVAAARIVRALAPEGGLRAWESLGAYRYLVSTTGDVDPDLRHGAAVALLVDYDRQRGSTLVGTLERYLADRSVVPTARALSIHPNTLRQRLERVEALTGLDLAREDLLSLELAIMRHRLLAAAG